MKYLFIGLFAGILLSIVPVSFYKSSVSVLPSWEGSISDFTTTQYNSKIVSGNSITLNFDNRMVVLKENGELLKDFSVNGLAASSGNGQYYVRYDKVGSELQMFNINNEPFWKIKSYQYPYVSTNAKNILLMVADQSHIFIANENGNISATDEINDRLCTVISFSTLNDYAAAGFVNGRFYCINNQGKIYFKGELPSDYMVKNIAISNNGKFWAIHGGNNKEDFLFIQQEGKKNLKKLKLNSVQHNRGALCINDTGLTTILDYDRILIVSPSAKIKKDIKTFPARGGSATLLYKGDLAILAYPLKNGGSAFRLFNLTGNMIYQGNYPQDQFIKPYHAGNSILLRGTSRLYSYSIQL